MIKNVVSWIALTVAMGLAACGGADIDKDSNLTERALKDVPDDYDPVDAVLGNAQIDTSAVEEEDTAPQQVAASADAADPDYVGGDMALFLPTVKVAGKEVVATYRVNEASVNATLIQDGLKSGEDVQLPPGTYDITFTIKQLAGHPEFTLRNVELVAGRRLRRDVIVPSGEITLDTPGRGCAKKAIKLREQGATDYLPGKYFTCKPILLKAGNYEAKMGVIEVTGIQVYDGGKRTVEMIQQ